MRTDRGNNHQRYQVLLFYSMHIDLPVSGEAGERMRRILERLGESGQGIFILHHALLAFPKWTRWSEIVGIQDRSFEFFHDHDIHIEVADREHFVARGMESWDMVDETCAMNDAGEGSHILLSARHPKSMSTIAWVRDFRESRVFCLALGHDNKAFSHTCFREILERGILWCARADEADPGSRQG